MTELFERASRLRITYATRSGVLDVGDLWTLPLSRLDDVAKTLHRELREQETVSFVDDPPKKDEAKQVAFDVVKRVIEVIKGERATAAEQETRAALRQKVAAIIEEKQDGELRGKSLAELQEMLK